MKLMLFLAFAIFYSYVSTNESKYKYYLMCAETHYVSQPFGKLLNFNWTVPIMWF